MSLVITDDANLKLVDQAVAAGGPFHAVNAELFTNVGLSPTSDNVYSDLTPPLFAGYAKTPVIWSAPVVQPDSSYSVLGQNIVNVMTATGEPCAITGYALTSGVSVVVLEALEVFATPINIALPGDFCAFVPQFQIPSDGNFGSGTQVG